MQLHVQFGVANSALALAAAPVRHGVVASPKAVLHDSNPGVQMALSVANPHEHTTPLSTDMIGAVLEAQT